MPASPARLAAFEILLRVDRQNAFASELLHSVRVEKLTPADRRLTTELVMGVERWRSTIDSILANHTSTPIQKLDPEVLTVLRIGCFHLGWLRVPPRAAVHESVELVKSARKRSASGFVNAVLRQVQTQFASEPVYLERSPPEALAQSVESLATQFAHPLWLVERWWRHFGPATTSRICFQNQQIPTTVIRMRSPEAEEDLREENIEISPGALVTTARRVLAGDITQSQALREGKIFIQDEASQLVALLVGSGNNILDCCAAPGSKTSVLADRNPASQIIAADLHPHRARLMQSLLRVENVSILAADAAHLPLSISFNRILADVPCSGTGTLGRNPEIKWRLQPGDLADLHKRQVTILRAAIRQLSAGGRLVYSTCSLEPEENELVVHEAMKDAREYRLVPCLSELERLKSAGELAWLDLASLTSRDFLRTLPGVHPCDGFFAALIEKTAAGPNA